MKDSKEELIAKYLAGEATPDQLQELEEALENDPTVADALLSEAYQEVHLRETLSSSELCSELSENNPTSQIFSSRSPRAWIAVAATLLLIALSGWGVAAYVANELDEERTNIVTLNERISELEKTTAIIQTPKPTKSVEAEGLQIHSIRGLLMVTKLNANQKPEIEYLKSGKAPPMNQRLFTCPWGASEFRYDGNVTINIERNSAIQFNETKGQRLLSLEKGIIHVTNMSKTDKLPTEIHCALGTVRLNKGQVAVQVNKKQLAVEAAVNRVSVEFEEDGVKRSFTLRRGQYLIIKPGVKSKVVAGTLKLGLNPGRG